MEPSSDNSESSYTLSCDVEGQKREKTLKKSYLQTSTPFVRPKLSARVMGNLNNESLNVSNVSREMSLEVSSITEQPSQTSNQNLATSIHGNSDSLLVHTRESEKQNSDPSSILPPDSMNRGFYDITIESTGTLQSPAVDPNDLRSNDNNPSTSLKDYPMPDDPSTSPKNDPIPDDPSTSLKDDPSTSTKGNLSPVNEVDNFSTPDSSVSSESGADTRPNQTSNKVTATEDKIIQPVDFDADPPALVPYSADVPEVDMSIQAFLNKSFTETEVSESDLTPVQTADHTSVLETPAIVHQIEDAGTGVSKSSSSIYLDDGIIETKKTFKPPKRLTMAERARLEALASFGGESLGSVEVKKRDLKTELKREAEQWRGEKGTHQESKTTRLQSAKQESPLPFKDIAFGDGVKHQGRNVLPSFRRQAVIPPSGGGKRYQTRLERARAETAATFEGVPLDSLSALGQRKRQLPTDHTDDSEPKRPKRMTRLQRSRMEALQSFGGSNLSETLGTSKRRIARTLEAKQAEEEHEQDKENSDTVCV